MMPLMIPQRRLDPPELLEPSSDDELLELAFSEWDRTDDIYIDGDDPELRRYDNGIVWIKAWVMVRDPNIED